MLNELTKRVLSSIILIPIVFYCIFEGGLIFNLLITISLIISCYEWYRMVQKNLYFILGIIFLIFSYLTVYLIRNYSDNQGLYLFLFVFFICIFTDLGGYIFGKLFKGPKLTKISPKKTYAGMFGGLFLSVLMSYIFINYSYYLNLQYQKFEGYIYIIIFLISLVSQLGDIIISYFKRLSNIKDTGKIIPGHGGILDRTDGMIFVFPFFYILLIYNLI